MSTHVGVPSVRIGLEELGHIGHDGLLVWSLHIHICATHQNKHTSIKRTRSAENDEETELKTVHQEVNMLCVVHQEVNMCVVHQEVNRLCIVHQEVNLLCAVHQEVNLLCAVHQEVNMLCT